MRLTSFSHCYSFFSPAFSDLEVFFVRCEQWKIGAGDTGTLLWTHVVLTINENSSRPGDNLQLILSRKNFFLSAVFCRLNIQQNWIEMEDEMKCNMLFCTHRKPLYNYEEKLLFFSDHFARNCFETTKLKKWLKLMASKEKKYQNIEKIGKRKLDNRSL